jgi:hypothetical protein
VNLSSFFLFSPLKYPRLMTEPEQKLSPSCASEITSLTPRMSRAQILKAPPLWSGFTWTGHRTT